MFLTKGLFYLIIGLTLPTGKLVIKYALLWGYFSWETFISEDHQPKSKSFYIYKNL